VTFLNQITTSSPQEGQRIVIAGVEGVGKTTLAAASPRCLLVPMEMGYGSMTVHKTPMITSFDDSISLLEEIRGTVLKGQFPYKSLAFDSATALERLINDKTITSDPDVDKAIKAGNPWPKGTNMETVHGGYGKSYGVANDLFAKFLGRCDELAKYGGINIIFTCHVFASRITDPAHGEYDSWDLLLHSPKNNKTYGKREMLTQWADMIGFLYEPLFVQKAEKGQQLVKAIGANQGRQLAIERSPGWVAKNRYGLTNQIAIPKPEIGKPFNGWNYIAQPIYDATSIDLYNREV